MSSKSDLIAKNAGDELEKIPSTLTRRCREVAILGVSFMFTIAVACCILFYVNNNKHESAMEIERLVESILDARGVKFVKSETRNVERKFAYLDENQGDDSSRNKRAIHEFKLQGNGKRRCDNFDRYLNKL